VEKQVIPAPGVEVSTQDMASNWEALALSETADTQTRGEAIGNLAKLDAARGQFALEMMLNSNNVNDRYLAVDLLKDLYFSTGDPSGYITSLLQRASNDTEEGVAFQARRATIAQYGAGASADAPY
jgi:HEAT repeat protein